MGEVNVREIAFPDRGVTEIPRLDVRPNDPRRIVETRPMNLFDQNGESDDERNSARLRRALANAPLGLRSGSAISAAPSGDSGVGE